MRRGVRRTRPSLVARMRAFWLLGIVVFVLLGVGVYEAALWPGFHLSHVNVIGTDVVDKGEVVRRASIDPETNLWFQNMRLVAARIETIPYVATARVHRSFPASVWIDVVERVPDGCVTAQDGSHFTVDAAARVLETGCERMTRPSYQVIDVRQAPKPGTFLHSSRLVRLQADAHALEKLQPGAFVRYTFDRFDELEATMRGGLRVRFGSDDDLAVKARLIDPILSAVAGRLGSVKVVDVRAPAAPIVEYRATRHPRG